MKINSDKIYSVITGDIVHSSRLPLVKRKKLHKIMVESSIELRQAFKNITPFDVDIFRGDSWQMIVAVPMYVLKVALFYRSILRAKMESHKFNTRMAIALGHIDFIPGSRVAEGHGEAYELSGKAFENLSKSTNMIFVFPNYKHEKCLNAIVQLIDAFSTNWSDKQALAITGALRGWKQEKIAKTCWKNEITQQAVAQHLDRAGWNAVEKGLIFFEDCLKNTIKDNNNYKR